MKVTFNTQLRLSENKKTAGIVVPEEILMSLNAGKRPAVKVSLADYSYRSTVGKMGDLYMISLSSENRTKAGLRGDEILDVTLELDTESRAVEPPNDLRAELNALGLLSTFESASPSKQKEFVRQVEEAKSEETRQKRIAKVIEELKAKR